MQQMPLSWLMTKEHVNICITMYDASALPAIQLADLFY